MLTPMRLLDSIDYNYVNTINVMQAQYKLNNTIITQLL